MTGDSFKFDPKAFDSIDFLTVTWELENSCEKATDELLSTLGTKAPQTLPNMGILLGYLDGVSSCLFGCNGGDHLIEQQVFRACNRARGAIRLLRMGFYDESLMLTRANAETANLLMLFTHDPGAIAEWKAQEKWTGSPVKIRLKLEAFGAIMPADQHRYKILSGMAAHSGAEYAPSAHNVITMPMAAGRLQQAGLLLALNESALQVVWISIAARGLIKIPTAVSESIKQRSLSLLDVIGGITTESYEEHWENQRKELEAQSDYNETEQ